MFLTNLLHSMKLEYSDTPWMKDFVKNQIKWKHQIYKTFIKNSCTYSDDVKLQKATSVLSEMISRREDEYQNHTSSRVNDPTFNARCTDPSKKQHFTMVKKCQSSLLL